MRSKKVSFVLCALMMMSSTIINGLHTGPLKPGYRMPMAKKPQAETNKQLPKKARRPRKLPVLKPHISTVERFKRDRARVRAARRRYQKKLKRYLERKKKRKALKKKKAIARGRSMVEEPFLSVFKSGNPQAKIMGKTYNLEQDMHNQKMFMAFLLKHKQYPEKLLLSSDDWMLVAPMRSRVDTMKAGDLRKKTLWDDYRVMIKALPSWKIGIAQFKNQWDPNKSTLSKMVYDTINPAIEEFEK